MNEPYNKISEEFVGELSFVKAFRSAFMENNFNSSRVLLFENDNQFKYILKRGIYPFNFNEKGNKNIQITNLEKFLNLYFSEYNIMRIYSLCPY